MKNCKPLWREANLEAECCQTDGLGALLEVQMSKRSTPLWRETNFEVKFAKHILLGTLLKLMSKKCKPL